MHLSRLELDLRHPAVLRDLSDLQRMHRRVMSGFPDLLEASTPRKDLQVLHRVEWAPRLPTAVLLVQSSGAPDWSKLPEGFLAREGQVSTLTQLEAGFSSGKRYRFRLRANPTKRIESASKAERLAGVRRAGRRVPLLPDAWPDWLAKQGLRNGFRILAALEQPDLGPGGGQALGSKAGADGQHALTYLAVRFDGLLEVTEPEAFCRAWKEGLGPGKAYGFGLLSLLPQGE